jgi:hypothetical protein
VVSTFLETSAGQCLKKHSHRIEKFWKRRQAVGNVYMRKKNGAITGEFLSQHPSGLIVPLNSAVKAARAWPDNPYRTAHGRLLHDLFNKISGAELTPHRAHAQPTAMGSLSRSISFGADITSAGVIVKKRGSLDLAVPDPLVVFLPAIHHAALDTLKLYGPEAFKNAALQLVVQRTDVAPGEAHRSQFAHWHDHMDEHGKPAIDLVYSFADFPPIQFKDGPAEPYSLTRFGAEIKHISPRNTTDKTLRRTWGAVLVLPHESPVTYTDTPVLRATGEQREDFIARGEQFIEDYGPTLFFPAAPAPEGGAS